MKTLYEADVDDTSTIRGIYPTLMDKDEPQMYRKVVVGLVLLMVIWGLYYLLGK